MVELIVSRSETSRSKNFIPLSDLLELSFYETYIKLISDVYAIVHSIYSLVCQASLGGCADHRNCPHYYSSQPSNINSR